MCASLANANKSVVRTKRTEMKEVITDLKKVKGNEDAGSELLSGLESG